MQRLITGLGMLGASAFGMHRRSSGPDLAKVKIREIEAEQKAGYWLHLGNKAAERGQRALAERHYERAQKWHDEMNELLALMDQYR